MRDAGEAEEGRVADAVHTSGELYKVRAYMFDVIVLVLACMLLAAELLTQKF